MIMFVPRSNRSTSHFMLPRDRPLAARSAALLMKTFEMRFASISMSRLCMSGSPSYGSSNLPPGGQPGCLFQVELASKMTLSRFNLYRLYLIEGAPTDKTGKPWPCWGANRRRISWRLKCWKQAAERETEALEPYAPLKEKAYTVTVQRQFKNRVKGPPEANGDGTPLKPHALQSDRSPRGQTAAVIKDDKHKRIILNRTKYVMKIQRKLNGVLQYVLTRRRWFRWNRAAWNFGFHTTLKTPTLTINFVIKGIFG